MRGISQRTGEDIYLLTFLAIGVYISPRIAMTLKPLVLLLLLVVNIKPAEAQQTYYFEECDLYGIREKYSQDTMMKMVDM